MQELTCIACPIGCRLSVEEKDGQLIVSGNRCPRGAVYATEEIRSPKRIVSATCRLLAQPSCTDSRMSRKGLCETRRLPVKSNVGVPKDRIYELLADIYALTVEAPIQQGTTLIANWKGLGIDVVAVRTLE
ncbi:DUF1667 domain-containing protein [Treponema sp.]